jgi:paraquat-inducible protein B
MSKQANPTLIGAFVLGALILGIVTIFLLAEETWFQERQQYVLYFEEAAQGLQVGAPVVFLGVKVGTVKHIQIGMEEGKKHFTVQVTIELDLQMIEINSGEQIDSEHQLTIRQLVDRGLRARLKMQSLLTGLLYVDLGFYPGKRANFISDNKKTSEIPTIPTTVEELTSLLEDFPMTEFLADLAAIGSSINKILASPAMDTIPVRLDATLSHLESLSAQLDSRGGPLLGEMEAGLTELHQAINAVQSAMVKVGKAADQVEKFADADSKIAGSITRAGTELANASRKLDQLADEESPAVRQFTLSLQEISRAARALRLLAESLERQPEAIIRGKHTGEK